MPSTAAEPDNTVDMEASGIEPTPNIPLEVSSTPSAIETYSQMDTQPAASEPPARAPLLEAPKDKPSSVSDLVPGVTANDMDLIQKLANGEAGQEILEALANTSPDYLNQIMQTEGIAPLDANTYNNDAPQSVPPPSLLGDRPPPHFNQNVRPPRGGFNGNFNRGGGPRPPFHRGGFRGGPGGPRGGRGRGGFRGRGGKRGECHFFSNNKRCDFGDNCVFMHTAR